jgi:hypothetical protein
MQPGFLIEILARKALPRKACADSLAKRSLPVGLKCLSRTARRSHWRPQVIRLQIVYALAAQMQDWGC